MACMHVCVTYIVERPALVYTMRADFAGLFSVWNKQNFNELLRTKWSIQIAIWKKLYTYLYALRE